jgi:hypothetical protein
MELTTEIARKWLNDRIEKFYALEKHSSLRFGKFDAEKAEREFEVRDCILHDSVPCIQLYSKDDESFFKLAELVLEPVYDGTIDCWGKYKKVYDQMFFKYRGVVFHTYKKEVK